MNTSDPEWPSLFSLHRLQSIFRVFCLQRFYLVLAPWVAPRAINMESLRDFWTRIQKRNASEITTKPSNAQILLTSNVRKVKTVFVLCSWFLVLL
jgi:hypothetical protein